MDRHWQKLEYPQVLERLASYTDFSGGKELALALTPAFEIHEVRERQALTAEARALLEVRPDFGLGGVSDIRPLVERARHNATLLPTEFLEIRATCSGVGRVRRLLTSLDSRFPGLADIAWRMESLPALQEAIGRVLDDRGEVRDTASEDLSRIRRELRVTQSRLQERLQRILTSPEVAPYLQEALITRRAGRFVIPVRTDYKGQVPGIVHDRSSSGATLFIEPTQLVPLNNALRELKLAEEEEVRRLLQRLTARVAREADLLHHTLDAVAELDLVMAMARYAADLDATAPKLLPLPSSPPRPVGENLYGGGVVRLKGARHPLIPSDRVVPVDIVVPDETHIVVITGPNTGGKTVTLKTVGLLTLMALSGMQLPVEEGAELSCFERVVVDIGDEQSIEQSLSTFSSHLSNILSFLDDVDHRSLVLLDELGAGTDPAEGAALAHALLEAFRRRRSMVFVATHYPELKLYAHDTPGVVNASVEFDVETLSPTYKVTMGLPGRSNAFAIARRLGMPEEIVKDAQSRLNREALHAEDMLNDLHRLRIQEAQARDAARQALSEAQKLQQALERRLEEIETERAQILGEARATAEAELESLREEVRRLRTRLRLVPSPEAKENLEALVGDLQALESRLAQMEPSQQAGALDGESTESWSFRLGDRVRVRSLGVPGVVVGLDGDEVTVQIGAIRTRLPLVDVEPAQPVEELVPRGVSMPSRVRSPGLEIDLRGQTVEEALERLERYLDQATMAGLPWVRVIHGKGTGTLRVAVQRTLKDHPLVASYETAPPAEGGEGATIVRLTATG